MANTARDLKTKRERSPDLDRELKLMKKRQTKRAHHRNDKESQARKKWYKEHKNHEHKHRKKTEAMDDSDFSDIDYDHDDELSKDEWIRRFGTADGFDDYDSNHDGVINEEEAIKRKFTKKEVLAKEMHKMDSAVQQSLGGTSTVMRETTQALTDAPADIGKKFRVAEKMERIMGF